MTEVVVDNGKAYVSEESATIATQAAAQAKAWAEESELQANSATSSADTALNAKNLAQEWATKTNGKVDGVDYSAKYYAQQIIPMASDIAAVAGNATNINTVAGISGNVTTVAGIASDVTAVKNISSNVTTVAGISGNVTAVANNASNINAVAGNATNINAVNANKTNIDTVASNISNINTTVSNLPAINAAPTYANQAAASAELSAQYANDKINQTHISNCITEIPQDIKLELNNGTLTLKAGSKVYVPNGDGVFDVVTVPSDVVFHSGTIGIATMKLMLCCNLTGGYGVRSEPRYFVSGSTAPTNTNQIWYDTTNNAIKAYEGGSWVRKYSLPIGIYVRTNGVATSIDQVFNGFGYIGSTVFALPGVKGLIPNGRNADGSLKNIEFMSNSVKINTSLYANIKDYQLCVSENYFITPGNYTYNYDEIDNYYLLNNNKILVCNCGSFATDSNNKIINFNVKTAFHALDYNDSPTISGWSMPSSKYIDLTLGASGATYTAPANGYFCLDKAGTQNEYIDIKNNTTGLLRSKTTISAPGTESIAVYMPCKKGDEIAVVYTATGTTNRFRFIYAEGENV